MGGKPKDPAYWSRWRAAHPAYQARERVRSASRDRSGRDRAEESRRRRARRSELEARKVVETRHPLIDQAERIVRPAAPAGSRLVFPAELRREDAVSIAVLALLEGRDAARAVRRWMWLEQHRAARTSSLERLVEIGFFPA